jgi:hypothetical protein
MCRLGRLEMRSFNDFPWRSQGLSLRFLETSHAVSARARRCTLLLTCCTVSKVESGNLTITQGRAWSAKPESRTDSGVYWLRLCRKSSKLRLGLERDDTGGCTPIFDTALLNAGLVEDNKRPRRVKSGEHDALASVNHRDVRSPKFPRSDFRDEQDILRAF